LTLGIRPRLTRLLPALPFAALLALGPGATASAGVTTAQQGDNRSPILTAETSGTTNRLQAVSPVNSRVVWASGLGGTYTLTTDGGKTWRAGVVPGAETLQFRDVQGVSARTAYLLSSGTGTDSRIYKTENGGNTWTLQFENQNPNAFYDCFAFWNGRRGITTADSVNGRFPAIRTTNGTTWQDIGNNMPAPLPNEGSFAASGTCVATQGSKRAWIGTGAAMLPVPARILATTDGGNTWAAYNTPILQDTGSSGVFSVAFHDGSHGILGGGDFVSAARAITARSRDGGKTWQLTSPPPFSGAVFGLSYAGDARIVVATGPSGSAWTPDEGTTWFSLPGLANFWAVAFANEDTGWLVGTQGRIEKISFSERDND
jgi:photosystem II stability/assembly factor-like uncharacterized protein